MPDNIVQDCRTAESCLVPDPKYGLGAGLKALEFVLGPCYTREPSRPGVTAGDKNLAVSELDIHARRLDQRMRHYAGNR